MAAAILHTYVWLTASINQPKKHPTHVTFFFCGLVAFLSHYTPASLNQMPYEPFWQVSQQKNLLLFVSVKNISVYSDY